MITLSVSMDVKQLGLSETAEIISLWKPGWWCL